MPDIVRHAAWILIAAFVLSCVYELYRATLKAGTSRHDSTQAFVRNNVPFYVLAGVVIGLLYTGSDWTEWVGLVFCGVGILGSIFFYNRTIIIERQPGVIDWFEDLVFTGLLFVAGALLLYEVLGVDLRAAS